MRHTYKNKKVYDPIHLKESIITVLPTIPQQVKIYLHVRDLLATTISF